MTAGSQADFTPQRERARHDALVERARRAPPGGPLWLLCPRASLAAALELRVGRAGGGFVRVLEWDALARAAEDALGLASPPDASELDRAALVEAALDARGGDAPGLARALAVDPYGVAAAALGVLDELRMAGWDGDPRVPAALAAPTGDLAMPLVRGHLELLAALLRALESGLAAAGTLDRPARLRRVLAAPSGTKLVRADELFVDGLDRLTFLERGLLERVAGGGTRVDVAPWVVGWRGKGARPPHLYAPPATALEAYERGVTPRDDAGDDASIVEVSARDADDEAEGVARWLAELPAAARAEVAVAVPAEPGYAPRVARALARYGLAARYAGSEPAHRAPLWQVVRASVRLAWTGADAVELAAVLSAPGAGIWGADRDRVCARLRERVPTSWDAVREVLARATDPAVLRATTADDAAPGEGSAAPEVAAASTAPDPARVRQLELARRNVEELIALWEAAGPLARRPPGERLVALGDVARATLARFANPMRLQAAFDDARTVAAWTAAARAIGDAATTVLARLERGGAALPAADASVFLAPVERLLGTLPDAQGARRGDGVPLLVAAPFVAARPAVLVALGFQRGLYPAPVSPLLLLGPLEREALAGAAAVAPGLAEIADEGARAALAEREARRILSLPTRALIVVSPRRDAQGRVLQPSLARGDLRAAYPPAVATARARRGPRTIAEWLADGADAAPSSTPRSQLVDAVAALGAGDVARARPAVLAVAARGAVWRDLFACRWRPDQQFVLGDLVRHRLATESFTPASLEWLFKCRYSFLTSSLLRLRGLSLARAPSLALRDRALLAQAALRALDVALRAGATPSEAVLDAAVDDAIRATLPWALRGEARIELEEVRRTVRGFVARYADVRRAWGLGATALAEGVPASPEERPVARLPLGTAAPGAPRALQLLAPPLRVEARATADGAQGVVVDLRLGRTESLARERGAGLGIAAALLPAVAEAQLGVPIAAFASLSLGRAEGDVLPRARDAAAFAGGAGVTTVGVDPAVSLEDFRADVFARLAAEVDAIALEGAELAPHSRARRAELEKVGARSCEYCAAALACRFRARAS